MHTVRNKHNFVRIEPARLKSNDSQEKLQSDIISTNSDAKTKLTNIINLKLLGQAQNQLESDFISGSNKVRINIGKVTGVKERLLQSMQKIQHSSLTIEDETINKQKIIIPSFSTTSAIFTQHCMILKDLKKRIDALKFSYQR